MEFRTNKGEKLNDLLKTQKVMLVFLRHFGCTFCRETMHELSEARPDLELKGVRIVVVHMINGATAQDILNVYGLGDIDHISDSAKILYKKYDLSGTGFKAMFGVKNWWRALVAGIGKGHLVGKPAGDPWQMPGVFVIQRNKIMNKFTYKYVSDRPDFRALAFL